jgi:hypothetical protein
MPIAGTSRLALVLAATLLAGTAFAGGHKKVLPPVEIPVDAAVRDGVLATLRATEEGWNNQDTASLLKLWDTNDQFPTYLAEEQSQWFVGWPRLNAYLDPPRPNPAIEAFREQYSGIQVKQIAPDLAIAIWYMHFEMKVIASHPIGEDIRVSAVLRKTDDGWKYIHWAESPKSAPVYLEDLMEKSVSDDWDEFYEEARRKKAEVWRKKREQQKSGSGQ